MRLFVRARLVLLTGIGTYFVWYAVIPWQ